MGLAGPAPDQQVRLTPGRDLAVQGRALFGPAFPGEETTNARRHRRGEALSALGRILILDEIVVKPGLADAYATAYRRDYAPGAERRGMRLDGAWRNPPVQDFEGVPTTLYFLWSVADVPAWWRMRLSRTPEGLDERFEKLAWWQEAEAMTVSRKRKLLTALPAAPSTALSEEG
jgi:hypothetical protein